MTLYQQQCVSMYILFKTRSISQSGDFLKRAATLSADLPTAFLSVCLFVRLAVGQTPVLCLNEWT